MTPQRKFVYDKVLSYLENGNAGEWRQGWTGMESPVNAVSGTRYRGVNFLALFFTAYDRGYTDNRWVTFKQMQDKEWSFKTDAEGKSLGKGAGVTIEFFEMYDKETQKPFDKSVLIGLDEDEKQEYLRDNVRTMRKYYRVFNGDVIDGIPEREKTVLDESGYNQRAEDIIRIWSETECPIIFQGTSAFYRRPTDMIYIPPRERFVDLQEFYGTTLHEIGHSTGHEKRLNRPFHTFGTSEYAEEELRAEFASIFLEQDLGVHIKENHIENNSAYIQSWLNSIKENPDVLFKSIADADKIAKYVMQKEKLKETESYASTPLNGQEQQSKEYILPSEVAARAVPQAAAVDMSERGMDSLKRFDDREIVERAMRGNYGAVFTTLYNGGSFIGDESLDESSLLQRLAVYTSDEAQLLRILKSSGQYRDEKPNIYYEKLAKEALREVSKMRRDNTPQTPTIPIKQGHVGANTK